MMISLEDAQRAATLGESVYSVTPKIRMNLS